jgi:hypothetical protein
MTVYYSCRYLEGLRKTMKYPVRADNAERKRRNEEQREKTKKEEIRNKKNKERKKGRKK